MKCILKVKFQMMSQKNGGVIFSTKKIILHTYLVATVKSTYIFNNIFTTLLIFCLKRMNSKFNF